MPKKSSANVIREQTGRKLDLIGSVLIYLAGIWLVLTLISILTQSITLDLNLGFEAVLIALQCLLGVGILQRRRSAYYAGRILGVLALLGAVIYIPSLLLAGMFWFSLLFSTVVANPVMGVLMILSLITSLSGFALWIYLFFLLISKPAKQAFQVK